MIDGVLLLDKPLGLSSNQALQQVKRLFNAAKAGHTGTLDPLAAGLLPLTFGEATKFGQMLLNADKTYEATIQLGIRTSTGDAEGCVLSRQVVQCSTVQVEDVLKTFLGEISQLPPMYSALKRDGKPLYEYAREGVVLERQPRRILIHSLDALEIGDDFCRIRVRCSKGTYIRTLGMDIGEALGCGAHLSALRRTGIGDLDIGQAVEIFELEAQDESSRLGAIQPVDTLVKEFSAVYLEGSDVSDIRHGRSVFSDQSFAPDSFLRLYDAQGPFLGLGQLKADRRIYPTRLLAEKTR